MKIYKITNIINNKVYIGLTTQDLSARIAQHHYDYQRSDVKLYRAMRKYGWENFIFEIIEDNIDNIDILREKEQYYINLYDSYYNGYNSTLGGEGVKTVCYSDEEIIQNYLKTKSSIKTAQELEIGENTVLRALKKNNIELIGSGSNNIKNNIGYENVINDYLITRNIKETAHNFNISTESVSRILKQYNIQIAHYGLTDEEERELIKLYIESNKSLSQLEQETGISRKRISRILNKHEIPIDNKRNRNCQKIKMVFEDKEIVFESISECARYIVKNNLAKSKIEKTIRAGITYALENDTYYYNMRFYKI